jgi:hypothetical protein
VNKYNFNAENECVSLNFAGFAGVYSSYMATSFTSNYLPSQAASFIGSYLVQPVVEFTINWVPAAHALAVGYSKEYIIQNAKIRASYKHEVAELAVKFQARLDSGIAIDDEFAREIFADRNKIKYIERSKMDSKSLEEIYHRNEKKYGDKHGPNFDYFVKKGKSFAEIAESAVKTGGEDLGLKTDMFKCLFDHFDNMATIPADHLQLDNIFTVEAHTPVHTEQSYVMEEFVLVTGEV